MCAAGGCLGEGGEAGEVYVVGLGSTGQVEALECVAQKRLHKKELVGEGLSREGFEVEDLYDTSCWDRYNPPTPL